MNYGKPKNQHAWVVLLFLENPEGFSMSVPCSDMFYKFQSRLGELDKANADLKIVRLPMTKKNRFGHTMNYTHYKCLNERSYLLELYNSLNENGFINIKK